MKMTTQELHDELQRLGFALSAEIDVKRKEPPGTEYENELLSLAGGRMKDNLIERITIQRHASRIPDILEAIDRLPAMLQIESPMACLSYVALMLEPLASDPDSYFAECLAALEAATDNLPALEEETYRHAETLGKLAS